MKLVKRAKPLLGTIVEIKVYADEISAANFAISGAFAEIERIENILSIHSKESEVYKINLLSEECDVTISDTLSEILNLSLKICNDSSGVFNVCFPKKHSGRKGFSSFKFNNKNELHLTGDIKFDFGGIGKGYAVDQAVLELQKCGINTGIVNAGGELRVFGDTEEMIYLPHPENKSYFVGSLPLNNSSLATSSNYFRNNGEGCYNDIGIVNPFDYSVWKGNASISIKASSCAIADALTKVAAIDQACLEEVLGLYDAEAFIYGD